MRDAYICAGVRTPIGRYGGALSAVRPDDLAGFAIKSLMETLPGLPGEAVDDVLLGCANQAGEDNRNVARMAACWPACRRACSGRPSTGSAAPASTRSAARPARSSAARPS